MELLRKQKKQIRDSAGRKTFIIFNYAFCILVALICVMPVIHVLAQSFSGKDAVVSERVAFWPVDFNLENYQMVLKDSRFFNAYGITVLRSIIGWVVSLFVTVMAAYPMSLSKRNFPARPFFVVFYMIPMLFNGGMIPTYLVVKNVGLLDSIWALIFPCAVSVYNLMLMTNFMKSLPEAILESAYIDGATHFRTMLKIVLPLCLPSLATISLFIVLNQWNAWFDGMIYIKNINLKPLQTYLRSVVIVDANVTSNMSIDDGMMNVTADGANGAKIFLALLPIFCIYPFLQKHFAKGIVRGSVKE